MGTNQTLILDREQITYRYEPEIDGGTLFIYAFNTKNVYRSNIIGYKILKMLEEGDTHNSLTERIHNEFPDVDKNIIENDVLSFLNKLKKDNLLKAREE